MDDRMISAAAHITKHPDTCVDPIDAACRDKAPKIVDGGDKGDVVVIEGMKRPTAMGLVAEISEKQMAHPSQWMYSNGLMVSQQGGFLLTLDKISIIGKN